MRFVREQAEFWNALPEKPLDLALVSACARCTSDHLYDDHESLTLICVDCGYLNSALELRAGRLAKR